MADRELRSIDPEHLRRAVLSVARHFRTNRVYVIGSQALLVATDDVARELRFSHEIDLYPANRAQWEADRPSELASEEINGLFGEGSEFHKQFGFFIDGVDETTARLAEDWEERAVTRRYRDGDHDIVAVAPAPDEVVAAKLVRGDTKDLIFAARCLRAGLARIGKVRTALGRAVSGEVLETCLARLSRAYRARTNPERLEQPLAPEEIDRILGLRRGG